MRALVLALLAGCGRIGFDSLSGTNSTNENANVVFLTSRQVAPGALGGLAGADQLCETVAGSAGLDGRYVAWLSTPTQHAIDRLAGARGWIRFDGLPFADTASDIAAGRIFYPPSLDESGIDIIAKVATGTDGMGHNIGSTSHCGEWMDPLGDTVVGFSRGTSTAFTHQGQILPCADAFSIYCFGIDREVAIIPPAPATGKLLFVTATLWPSGGGIASADQFCMQQAGAAGRSGTFIALLATSTTSIATRVANVAGPIVRSDGVVIASSAADLVADNLQTSPNLHLDGSAHIKPDVFAGAFSPSQTSGSSCLDWTLTMNSDVATLGDPRFAMKGWFGLNAFGTMPFFACNSSGALYCLEQ